MGMPRFIFPQIPFGRTIAFTVFSAIVLLNGIAWMQARSMTHYVAEGERTAKPEKLSFLDKLKLLVTGVQVPRPTNQTTPASEGLPFQTYRIPLNTQESLETWFVPANVARNRQEIVLLFPPYTGSKASVLAPAKVFHDLGYDVLLVDFRGAGGSTGDNTTLGIREANDVVAAYAFTQQKWPQQPVILYGASMGASAVMRAVALDKLQPQAIILESPFDRLLQTVRHRFSAMGLPSSPGAELIVWWGGWQLGIDGFAHNPVDYARQIQTPALLFHGQGDQRVTITESESIYEQLAGQKEFVLLPGIGHGGLAGEHPQQWQQQVKGFLQK
jgi:dipeptidyl aminopeptidase/acylaminoacyl peptidase